MKIRNKVFLVMIYVLMVSLVLVGCGNASEKMDEAINPPAENAETEQSNNDIENTSTNNTNSGLEARADKEGISVNEMEKTIDELTIMTAEKYGSTKEEYIEMLKKDGKTPFDEFAVAADYMEITIKEYYEYEKANASKLTDEQKETMAGMNNAAKELENIDMEAFQNQGKEIMNQMQAMQGNSGDKVVTGDIKELGKYEVSEVSKENSEEGVYEVAYTSLAKCDDIVAYFKDMLEGTPNYTIVTYPGVEGASITGTINGKDVGVVIDNEDGDEITKVEYGYFE
ncbi:hypothetical protein [Crassaminicella profunda]|uniref:hypothetical protein n=1 Tax=Crassaminicella profunda TaxID=1286698 RepID=UPI001CA631D2|nr:hypothetical protein [Crassaminicella profunda]QZY53715.1 hypothetical protein K7H06_11650 [Crassaminicella profunda]